MADRRPPAPARPLAAPGEPAPSPALEAFITVGGRRFVVDLAAPIDISIAVDFHGAGPRAFGLPPPTAQPVKIGDFIGDTRQGGSVNCELLTLCAHGSGTHTECAGHIVDDRIRVGDVVDGGIIPATLITVRPETFRASGETYPAPHADTEVAITARELDLALLRARPPAGFSRALVVRTLPNDPGKRSRDHSGQSPPYLSAEAAAWMRAHEVDHLVVDVPSLDRADDGGRLWAHRAFWEIPAGQRTVPERASLRTVTELAYIASDIADGCFLMSLQVAPLASDAAPSRPVLYRAVNPGQQQFFTNVGELGLD